MCSRYDVLLHANQAPRNYWISALAQNATRVGSPGGYGVLRYAGAPSALPSELTVQPESIPAWTFGVVHAVGLFSYGYSAEQELHAAVLEVVHSGIGVTKDCASVPEMASEKCFCAQQGEEVISSAFYAAQYWSAPVMPRSSL